MTTEKITPKDYDERIYRRGPQGVSRAKLGLILIALLIAGTYLAVNKQLPFTHHYELKAVFTNGVNIRKNSPVRIAGVNVGKVTGLQSKGNAAEVTFTVDDEGLPIHKDATVRIRPRIFLEGNFFLDVHPGSPSAPDLHEGDTIPITHTSTAVQLDEILTSLQEPARENLRVLLQGYGTALEHEPTPAEDVTQDPAVQGKKASVALNQALRYGGKAGRDTSIVNDALLGTQPHDLSKLIAAQGSVFSQLNKDEQALQDLIVNFDTTTGALAAESNNLGRSVQLLAPTLENARPALLHLSDALPPLRAWARDITPGIKELPATITAGSPWLNQTRKLLAKGELGYIAKQLKLAAPGLALAADQGQGLFSQIDLTSRCADDVLLPTGNIVVNDAFNSGVENYKELFYGTVGFSGETQDFDGNGPYLRFQTGGGPQLARSAIPGGGFENDYYYGNTIEAPTGSQPVLGSPPPYKTDVPCYQNALPDVNGPAGGVGPPSPAAVP
jgi:phospholipid/cholesterol/gamma-HCH transport system substrate-binding protein